MKMISAAQLPICETQYTEFNKQIAHSLYDYDDYKLDKAKGTKPVPAEPKTTFAVTKKVYKFTFFT